MRHPSGHVECRIASKRVGGVEAASRNVEEIAHMIEDHDRNDQTAEHIDCFKPDCTRPRESRGRLLNERIGCRGCGFDCARNCHDAPTAESLLAHSQSPRHDVWRIRFEGMRRPAPMSAIHPKLPLAAWLLAASCGPYAGW